MILWLDFETRSHCDLKTRGAYAYATDPSTEVICMSYAFGDGPLPVRGTGGCQFVYGRALRA